MTMTNRPRDVTTDLFSNKTVEAWRAEETLVENECFFAVYDAYPVNPGHVLIISKRSAVDMFELSAKEFVLLREILHSVKDYLRRTRKPDGYNIGANCGTTAGQTVMHFHLHVIPRYKGDVDDPRGGVRNLKLPIISY